MESVVYVSGKVRRRPPAMVNPSQSTGEIEIEIDSWKLLNPASASLPFQPSEEYNLPNEEIRSKHRYLDLRRPDLTNNLRLRSRVAHRIRCCLHDQGFTEVETPLLLRSTPEGAREFIVPTRIRAAESPAAPTFYALPQSPQQPKQLLMASGVTDKYFQIAKCFRDEAGRKDRQPEFTQVDMEMAFIDGAPPPSSPDGQTSQSGEWRIGGYQVRSTIENLVREVWLEATGLDVLPAGDKQASVGFPVTTYAEAMSQYGSDKPDTRFGLRMVNLRKYLQASDVPEADALLEERTQGGHTVEIMAVRIPKRSCLPDSETEKLSKGTHSKSKGKETSSVKSLSNTDIKELMKSNGQATRLERFKVPQPSPHVLARLLLSKSHHVKQHLSEREDGWTPDNVDVERLAQGIEKALEVGQVELAGTSEQEEETHLFVTSRRDPPVGGSTEMGDLRLRLRDALVEKDLLRMPSRPHFLWVTEFPLLTQSDEDKTELSGGRWSATHHPFTSPSLGSLPVLQSILDRLESAAKAQHAQDGLRPLTDIVSAEELESLKGQHYDLVLDGVELGGGSVRIHDACLQRRLLSLCLQLSDEEVSRFDHLLSALSSGCPPHAGIALGFDRLMALLATKDGEKTKRGIRDVIAFPKTAGGKDALFNAPSTLDDTVAAPSSAAATGPGHKNETHEEEVLREFRLARRAPHHSRDAS
ncbi:unnamed protein product [Parajaminaea phylloscopi]